MPRTDIKLADLQHIVPAAQPATYRLRVSPKGLVPVGPSYTKLIGAVPGDYIKVIHEEDGLWLEKEPAEEPVNCPIGTAE